MATFRSNLNGVSNTYGLNNGLQILKNRITTCFKNWRSKGQEYQKQKIKQQEEKHFEFTFKEYSLVQKTSDSFRNLSSNFKSIFSLQKRKCKKINSKSTAGIGTGAEHNLQIVAKLLSSTLIATTTTTLGKSVSTYCTAANCQELSSTKFAQASSMTILSDTITQVRLDYPDLDTVVRSILMARAQTGATIADIKADYRKNTDEIFPIYENITEYLLSIPHVSARCSAQGTRIFNILPSSKTQHIYELVTEQKPQQQYPVTYNYGRRPQRSYTYNSQYSRESDYRNTNEYRKYIGYDNQNNNQQTNLQSPDRQMVDINRISDYGNLMDNNIYYQDNCKHFYNRLHNTPLSSGHHLDQPKNVQPLFNTRNNNRDTMNNIYNLNNLNARKNFRASAHNMHNMAPPPYQPQVPKQQQPVNTQSNQLEYSPLPVPSLPPPFSPEFMRSSQYTEYSTDPDYAAHLFDFPLLGDDFFLFLARMELKCKFKKTEKVLQSGLCISGQSISDAIKRVRKLPDCVRSIIVNIGSVDIMRGTPLVRIEHNLRKLINIMHKKSITPILTTLAPLANYTYDKQMRTTLENFNKFIKREGRFLTVIDVWSCLVNEKGQTLFDCFQSEPRSVTGTKESYLFWNKIGRQRVLQLIESQIEY